MSEGQIASIVHNSDLKMMQHLEKCFQSAEAQQDTSRMFRIHSQMDLVVQSIAQREPMADPVPEWHEQARKCTNMVEAIKLVREHTGWGLRASKDWVDENCAHIRAQSKERRIEYLESRLEEYEYQNMMLRRQLAERDISEDEKEDEDF